MLEFKLPVLEDAGWIKKALELSGGPGNDDTFGSIFIWQNGYNNRVCKYEGFLLGKYHSGSEKYKFPVGKGDLFGAIEELIKDAERKNIDFVFGGLTENKVKWLEEKMPGRFYFFEKRDEEDYIYNTEDLIELKGKKYHSKRNYITKFNNLFSWRYEDICAGNLEECRSFTDSWFRDRIVEDRTIVKEKTAMNITFDNYDRLGFLGGIIRVDEEVVGITIGESINREIFDVHFEKALLKYRGLSAVINNEFAKHRLQNYRYINREEDMGLMGLRKAKLSYHPVVLLKRYEARLIN